MFFTTKVDTEWRPRFAIFPKRVGKRNDQCLWVWLRWYEFRYDQDGYRYYRRPIGASSDVAPFEGLRDTT